MTLEDRIARGQRVKLLVEDAVVQGVMADLDERGRRSFQNAVTDEDRRNVWALMNGMTELRRQLAMVVEDGEVALAEREQADKRAALQRGTGTA
jgi:hypothetical protein